VNIPNLLENVNGIRYCVWATRVLLFVGLGNEQVKKVMFSRPWEPFVATHASEWQKFSLCRRLTTAKN